ncbi:MAG: hypothetical protein H0W72_03485 [Planctomycetes bacterium]|nr:hypothetical protein [Planctomycetota bacterium]
MASPRRIYRIYLQLATDAATVRDFCAAQGEKIPGTVSLLLGGDRAKLLARWGEELGELCGVLDGTHDDSYLMEATQTFYWGSLFAASAGTTWEQLAFWPNRRLARTCGITTVPELRAAAERVVALGPERAKPEKLFLLWNVADGLYRDKTPAEDQWSLEQLMEADLQDMKKRAYLQPILRLIAEEPDPEQGRSA